MTRLPPPKLCLVRYVALHYRYPISLIICGRVQVPFGLILLFILGWCSTPTSAAEETEGHVGRRLPPEMRTFKDELTGLQVTALTTDPANDDKIYQTHPSWTADKQWVIFQSQRTGLPQLFAVRETSGEIVQLTDGPTGHGSACLSRKRNELLTIEGRKVVRIDIDELLAGSIRKNGKSDPAVAGELPQGAQWAGTPSWDAEERVLYMALEWPDETSNRRWSVHALELSTGAVKELLRQDFRISHVQANPFVMGLLMYAQETGGDAPQRMWIARADLSLHQPFYRETYDEWVTHEVWWDADHALFTIWPRNEEMRKKPFGITSVDLLGESKVHSVFPYWHVTGARGSNYAVGDTFDGEIYQVDLKSGDRTLLTKGHRVGRTGTHPHPSLRPDAKRVLFVSHHLGNPDLFLIDLLNTH